MTQLDHTKTSIERREIDLSISIQLAVYGLFCVLVALTHPSVVFLAAIFIGCALGFRSKVRPS